VVGKSNYDVTIYEEGKIALVFDTTPSKTYRLFRGSELDSVMESDLVHGDGVTVIRKYPVESRFVFLHDGRLGRHVCILTLADSNVAFTVPLYS